jgi:hypothetical protein
MSYQYSHKKGMFSIWIMPYNFYCAFLLILQKTVSLVSVVWAENKIEHQVYWSLMDSLGEENSLQLKVTKLLYIQKRILTESEC